MIELRMPTDEERKHDIEFITHIIFEIRDYAKEARLNPDDTLKAVANWILALLQVATYNEG